MDLIGRKDNQLDFIEFKKAGTKLTKSERKLRDNIERGVSSRWPTRLWTSNGLKGFRSATEKKPDSARALECNP